MTQKEPTLIIPSRSRRQRPPLKFNSQWPIPISLTEEDLNTIFTQINTQPITPNITFYRKIPIVVDKTGLCALSYATLKQQIAAEFSADLFSTAELEKTIKLLSDITSEGIASFSEERVASSFGSSNKTWTPQPPKIFNTIYGVSMESIWNNMRINGCISATPAMTTLQLSTSGEEKERKMMENQETIFLAVPGDCIQFSCKLRYESPGDRSLSSPLVFCYCIAFTLAV